MKILKSKKALSPVVASIILIAVTVAVSLAVAIWMGSLTTGQMGVEELRITKLTWGSNNNGFTITVNNTGTRDSVITQIRVNYATTGVSVSNLPLTLKAGTGTTIAVTYAYTNGTRYDISVMTQSGREFARQFIGGLNEG
jgi:flagellin-like protein